MRILRTVFIYLALVVFVCAPTCGVDARIRTLATAVRLTVGVLFGQMLLNSGKFPGPILGIHVAFVHRAKRKGLTKRWARSGGRIGGGG